MTGLEPGPYLRSDRLAKTFHGRERATAALEDVSFDVWRGEFISIIGPSGCGKSTLLKIILGVIPATGGAVHVADTQVLGPRVDVGMVFQTPALPPWRRVLDNVLLPIDVLRLPRREYRPRALELLSTAGLADFAESYPRELSGGMQQRVAICRALIHNPGLLLMDEPFGALDAMTRESMQAQLLRVWEQTGKTVVFVTHSIDEAVLLSDRVLVMSPRPGRIEREVQIALPRPRTAAMRASARFQEYALMLREALGLTGTSETGETGGTNSGRQAATDSPSQLPTPAPSTAPARAERR